jgi:hypothetical protein
MLPLKSELAKRLKTLKEHNLDVHHKKMGSGVSDATIAKIQKAAPLDLPEELLAFYREANGVELSWTMENDEQSLFGSISILPLQKAIFGENPVRQDRYEDAFEDMLWNDFYAPAKIKQFKQHRVLESVEGEPVFITFQIADGAVQLFHVEEETIKPLQVSFTSYIELIIHYLGAGNLREHLTSKGWEKKIRADRELQYLAKL